MIRLLRVCVYWIGKICSPRKEAVEQDEGTGLLECRYHRYLFAETKKRRIIVVKLLKLQSL